MDNMNLIRKDFRKITVFKYYTMQLNTIQKVPQFEAVYYVPGRVMRYLLLLSDELLDAK